MCWSFLTVADLINSNYGYHFGCSSKKIFEFSRTTVPNQNFNESWWNHFGKKCEQKSKNQSLLQILFSRQVFFLQTLLSFIILLWKVFNAALQHTCTHMVTVNSMLIQSFAIRVDSWSYFDRGHQLKLCIFVHCVLF